MSPLGPALGGDRPELLLDHPWRNRHLARFLDLFPVGIGVEAVVSQSDLAFVGNMGRDPGDELQVVHPLLLRAVPPQAMTDLALGFQERQPLQGEKRPDHVFPTRSASFLVLALTRL